MDLRKKRTMYLRKRANLTQAELAQKIGRSPSTVAKWEAGDVVPRGTPSEIKKLCEVYQCSIEDLIEAFERQLDQPN
jgi:transcriptional regulator with XRE-family HTH domain